MVMNRRINRQQPRSRDRRSEAAGFGGSRPAKQNRPDRSASKPQPRPARPQEKRAESSKTTPEALLPTKVQTVVVTPDEGQMRVDRFLEARFPGLSFSHIQRIVRKGELRVDGKRVDSKDRLEAGQSVRIPPL